MTTTTDLEARLVIAHAADAGFRLVRRQTGAGQAVWQWQRGGDPRPQFANRRVAVHWMAEFLARDGVLAFVSDAGQSIA